MAAVISVRPVANTGIQLSTLGLGGTGLANMYAVVADEEAAKLVEGAQALGVSLFDTAPCYGVGLSEQRLGAILPRLRRDSFVLSTKVGYDLVAPANGQDVGPSLFVASPRLVTHYDFSYDAAMRSIEGSLKRLKIDRVDMVAIHDPDQTAGADPTADPYAGSLFAEAMAGAYRALDELRAQKVIRAVGVGMNQWQMLVDFAREGDFDYFLCAGRYSLLRADAGAVLLPLCAKKGISVIIGGPYSFGIPGKRRCRGRDVRLCAGITGDPGARAGYRGSLRGVRHLASGGRLAVPATTCCSRQRHTRRAIA